MTKFSMLGRLFVALIAAFAAVSIIRAQEHNEPSSCQERATRFLSGPSERTLSALDGATGDSACWLDVSSSNERFNRLLELVATGNSWGARYLVKHLRTLDGGNLEDGLIALGQFGDHRLVELLRFARNGDLSDRELGDALTMLPLSLSDDPDAQLKVMQERRSRVAKIGDGDLSSVRSMALRRIDGFISEILSNK